MSSVTITPQNYGQPHVSTDEQDDVEFGLNKRHQSSNERVRELEAQVRVLQERNLELQEAASSARRYAVIATCASIPAYAIGIAVIASLGFGMYLAS